MALRGMIFDIGGTLVGTNPAHVEAWRLARRERFRVFPCVPELFQALPQRGIRTALATSSDQTHLQATCDSADIDLPSIADLLVTKADAEASKPAPDLVIVAWEKLAPTPAECARGSRSRRGRQPLAHSHPPL